MAHDPLFEQRIADALKAQGAKAEPKKMFGGVAFMINGNMSVGITNKGDFMVRFDGARHAEISKWPGAKPMTFGKGDTKGFLFVDADAVNAKAALDKWVKLSLAHISTLPAKAAKISSSRPSGKTAKAKTAPKKVAKKK
jgi:TfoX/Sxy family transcriptional regulator of competence genes